MGPSGFIENQKQILKSIGYLGFSEQPFNLDSDLRFLYLDQKRNGILRYIIQKLQNDEVVRLLILGKSGYGKTSMAEMIKALVNQLGGVLARYLSPVDFSDPNEILHAIFDSLNLEWQRDYDSSFHFLQNEIIEQSNKGLPYFFILEQNKIERYALVNALLFDLFNFWIEGYAHYHIVWFANDHIPYQPYQIIETFEKTAYLSKMNYGELSEFIDHRCSVAGRFRPLFNTKAKSLILELSGGVPREAVRICDLVLKDLAFMRKKKVDENDIKTVWDRLITLPPHKNENSF